MQAQYKNKSSIAILIIYIGLTILAASTAFYAFPVVTEAQLEAAVAIAFAASLTQLGGVGYFLSSLRSFKKELRRAYYLLALGIFIFSFVQLLPSLTLVPGIVNLLTNPTVSAAAFLLPFLLGALLIYLGVRSFARLLETPSVWRSIWLVGGLSLAAAAAALLLPANLPAGTDVYTYRVYKASISLASWCGMFGLAATILTFTIRRAIGPVYKNAMTWLAVALAVLTLTTFHEVIVKTYFLTSGYVTHQYSLWPYLAVGTLFLIAGYAFASTKRQTLFISGNPSYLDIVVNVAKLASKPAEIDVTLDKVRAISAIHGTNDQLTTADKAALVDAYRKIEDYLLTKERLRTFTRDGLRANLPTDFVQSLSKV